MTLLHERSQDGIVDVPHGELPVALAHTNLTGLYADCTRVQPQLHGCCEPVSQERKHRQVLLLMTICKRRHGLQSKIQMRAKIA